MSIIQNQIKVMQANHVTLQERFVKTKLNQAKLIVRHAREMGSLHKRVEERKSQVSSCCEYLEKEANSINKDLTKNDMIKEEIKKGQVKTHDTCATDPSFLTEQMQNKERHVSHILNTLSKSFEVECSTSSMIQPTRKKRRKRKRMRKRFDTSNGHVQLDFQIGKSPIVRRIGHGT